ncbi:MAG TPA: GxxExxY protein [Gemmatimonadaceae bacterium]
MPTTRRAREELNGITGEVVDSAMKVHRRLGPGLLESAYQACLVYELGSRKLSVRSQVKVPIEYEGVRIDAGYRIDLLVEDEVIVELKTVVKLLPVHDAQLMSYLRLSNRRVGLLINFQVFQLRTGIKRFVN